MSRARAGTSLIELLIALVLLDLIALGTLLSALTTHRIARTVAAGAAVDITRLEQVRMAASEPTCRQAPVPTLRALSLASGPTRPSMSVVVRCGR